MSAARRTVGARAAAIACLATLGALAGGTAGAQVAGNYKVDLAIPDAPATALVAVDASKLSRPSTTRELSATFSNFVGAEGRIDLPATFGIEIAPRLLFGAGRLQLSEYGAAPVLSRLRLSAAVRRGTAGDAPSDFAVGVRTSLVDRSDPHTDAAYTADVSALLASLAALRADMLAEGRNARACRMLACLRAADSAGTEVLPDAKRRYDAVLDALRQRARQFEEQAWNRPIWDVAAAARGRAASEGVQAPTAQEYAAWTLLGLPLGRASGQAVFGARGTYARDSTQARAPFAWSGMVGARLYAGSNRYKAFAEGQSVVRRATTEWLLNGGAEVHLYDSLWAVASAGYLVPTGESRSRFVSAFKLRVAPPTRGEPSLR